MASDYGDSDSESATTSRGQDWPCLRQFCVFMENRVGRLNELMKLLESPDIRVVAINIVDAVDCAMARLMFSNTDRAREVLELHGLVYSESDVVGVVLPDDPQPITSVCTALMQAEVNIHHAYALSYRKGGRGAIAMYVDDVDLAMTILEQKGHTILREGDLLDYDEYM